MKKFKILALLMATCFISANLALLFTRTESLEIRKLKVLERYKREYSIQDGSYEILYDKSMDEYFVNPIENCEGVITVSFDSRESAEKAIEILEGN